MADISLNHDLQIYFPVVLNSWIAWFLFCFVRTVDVTVENNPRYEGSQQSQRRLYHARNTIRILFSRSVNLIFEVTIIHVVLRIILGIRPSAKDLFQIALVSGFCYLFITEVAIRGGHITTSESELLKTVRCFANLVATTWRYARKILRVAGKCVTIVHQSVREISQKGLRVYLYRQLRMLLVFMISRISLLLKIGFMRLAVKLTDRQDRYVQTELDFKYWNAQDQCLGVHLSTRQHTTQTDNPCKEQSTQCRAVRLETKQQPTQTDNPCKDRATQCEAVRLLTEQQTTQTYNPCEDRATQCKFVCLATIQQTTQTDNLPKKGDAGTQTTPDNDHAQENLDADYDMTCAICLDVQKDCMMYPCGHVCTCYECGIGLFALEVAECPVCRGGIQQVVQIYL